MPLPCIGKSRTDFQADIAARRSYWIPAAEIVGCDGLLNLYNRHYVSDDYKSNLSSIRHNLRSSWDVDNDPFTTNQLGHPYLGPMYHGFARSAALNYAMQTCANPLPGFRSLRKWLARYVRFRTYSP